MQTIHVPYGREQVSATLPDHLNLDWVRPQVAEPAEDPASVVRHALGEMVGNIQLSDFAGNRSAAIAVNDKTRPVPHAHLLPPLLEALESIGIEEIIFVIATGTHPVMPPEEYNSILPASIIKQYRIVCHDSEAKDSLVYMGDTTRGTPVWINRHFMEADLHLVVGNMEPHQFMGFSGGVKSAAIGLAGKATINHNHSMMKDAQARLGEYEDNPARQDVEEIGRMIRVDFALNAILNESKQIVRAIAGEPTAVMAAGIPQVKQIFEVAVPQRYDVVIASPGGHPKDINVYQAQKGLAHATLITKPGGTVILAAACPEGTGSNSYEFWVTQGGMKSHQEVVDRFSGEGFRVGPHKAFQLSRDALQVRVLLVSDMNPDFVRQLLLEPVESLQHALDISLAGADADTQVAVMPVANATIPALAI